MLKVLHFYKTYYPDTFGGIEQVIYQLSESGSKYGVESIVLSLSSRGNIDDMRIGVQRVFYSKTSFEVASTPFSLSCIKKFKELARQADIIHYHYPFPFMDMLHFLCRVNKPTVVSYHSDIVKQKFFSRLYSPLMNRFLSSVDCIVAASPNYAKTSPVLQRFESKVKIIPYGLDERSYPKVNEEKMKYWQGRFGNKFFLFVGAFRYYKGLHTLLEAVHGTTFPVVIVGGGGIENEIRAKAKALNLSNVHFVGSLPDEDKATLLQLCYAIVFPSHLRSEAFGITLLEGAMYGKPLISCEIGTGTSFINLDGYSGFVIPPNNHLRLREVMHELYSNSELANLYGANAYARFKELFTSEKMSYDYNDVYNGISLKNKK
ncbi:glycosyltransferase family 4 protein [Citrobacter braakii]|uniref:glycosyltransferase family 4 protein n=1 Tax=Citrobacter braakii TaxID=57706 RepID=UPI0039B44503